MNASEGEYAPVTKNDLLDTARLERARWEVLLMRVSGSRRLSPRSRAVSEIRSLLAGLLSRERALYEQLTRVVSQEGRGTWPPHSGLHMLSPDPGADSSLANLRRESGETFQELLRLVVLVPEAELDDPYRFAWTGGRSLLDLVAACTFEFYRRHDPSIRAAIGPRPGQHRQTAPHV